MSGDLNLLKRDTVSTNTLCYLAYLLRNIGNDVDCQQSICPPTSHIKIIEVHEYLPPGVSRIIDRGGEHFIGVIDESTVLKYPSVPSNRESFRVEAQLLETLGSHPRVVAFKGLTEHGLALQYAPNGNLYNYMISDPTLSLDKRIYWCKQAAEAVSYIHSKRVIHCDISPRNFLLDKSFDLVLTDFQGMLKSVDGKTLLDGLSRECSKSFRPRIHGDYADVYTDIFAERFCDLFHYDRARTLSGSEQLRRRRGNLRPV